MRRLAAAAALLALALAIAAWWLPRWLAGGDARERLVAAARDATGRDVAIDALSMGLIPPRLVARGVRVGDATSPLLRAERVDLRLDLAGLLARSLVVEELALEGVSWRVVRTPDGIELPWRDADPRATSPGVAEAAAAGVAGALDLAVRRIAITRSLLVWDDPVATPPLRLELRDVDGEATSAGADAPLALTLGGALASGGTLRFARDPARAGAPDLEMTLEGVDLGVIAPYLGKDLALGGRVAGSVSARGPAASFESVDVALEIADATVRAGDVTATGPVGVTAKLAGALESLAGSFELDATRADLSAYGGAFRKPPGAPAKAAGKLVRDADGKLGVDGVRVKIEKMDGASLELEGTFHANAHGLRSEGLVARAGAASVAIDLRVEGQGAERRHRTRIETRETDARSLLLALAGRDALLEGPLTLDGTFAGPLDANALQQLAGALELAVGAGRIPEVSPLAEAIGALDRYDEVGRVLNRKKTERKLAPFLGDRFESISGRFDVAGGRAHTEALVLQYPGYRLAIRGAVGLSDRSLDAKGRLVLEPAIEAALGRRDDASPRAIEIAHVGGTLEHPKLEIDQAGAIAFAASLALAQKRDKWERKLDQALGNGQGGALLDALDGILGKKEPK